MKRIKKLVLALLALISVCEVNAKNPPEKGCRSYDLKIETVTFIDENVKEELTTADVISMRFPMELRHVEECPESSVSTLLNVRDVYQSWMPQLVNTIMDEKGITFTDAEGKVLYQFPADHFSTEKEVSTEKNEGFLSFQEMEKDVERLKEEGAKVSETETGTKVEGEGYALYTDRKAQSTYFVIFENGKETYTERTVYSLDGQNIQSKTEEQFLVTTTGKEFTKVTTRTYSNYKN